MNSGRIEKSLCDKSDIERINAFSRRELSEDEVYTFNLRLCDNEVDRDFECFSKATLDKLAELFTGRTGIFDHSMKSGDQKARIYEAHVERQQGEKTVYGEPLYALKAKAYMLKSESNAELISEIDAGIKKEVSVSCSVEKSVCSICGRDSKKERCTHINGRSYGGKLCYTRLEGALDAYEFSFVAVPAQKKAGVTKAFKTEEETDLDEIIKKIRSNPDRIELSKEQAQSVSDYIKSLEDGAALGEEYKKALADEVIKLFKINFPELDGNIAESVTAVMTVSELKSFKRCFVNMGKTPKPQLAHESASGIKEDYSHFRI